MKNLPIYFVFLLAISLSQNALATGPATNPDFSNRVSGYLEFYQNQGNFCRDTGKLAIDCTGAKYKLSQSKQFRPIRYVPVMVARNDGVIIGRGTTNDKGWYDIKWTGEADVDVIIAWRYRHKDGRFYVSTNQDHDHFDFRRTRLTAGNFDVMSARVGTAAAPDAIANLYDGALMVWQNSLRYSNRMLNAFTDVRIEAFHPACETACSYPNAKHVRIPNEGAAYQPQHRVMHELGHVASYLSNRDNRAGPSGSYMFNEQDGWNLFSAEWGTAGFEEGVATHFADMGLYSPNAINPATCLSSSSCTPNLAANDGSDCSDDQARQPLQVMRYLWQNYDSRNEFYDQVTNLSYEVHDTLAHFDPGSGNHERDEGGVDNDGRGSVDYQFNLSDRGVDYFGYSLFYNCGGVGD